MSNNKMTKGKLCLTMIVKNESKIIERLLRSVIPIIDSYCICDTGSTDDTADIIKRVMDEAGKTGVVLHEPFKNFGYNRTFALDAAKDYGEYALIVDADMKVGFTPDFTKTKEALVDNAYHVLMKHGGLEYYNSYIVKTGIGVKYVGPTHEYYHVPGNQQKQKLNTIWVEEVGDGNCKTDKFERDIRLLKEGLVDEPNNVRYYFYLAQSYRDLGNNEQAIEYYKKRVEMGGWIEEIFISCYEIGNAYKRLNSMPNALHWWLEAYNRHPTRSESLYEVVRYFRENKKYPAAKMICETARKIPYPRNDVLFIRARVYTHLLETEYNILNTY